MTEAHVHALCNLKKVSIVTIDEDVALAGTAFKRLQLMHYEPGYGMQAEIKRADFNQLLRGDVRPLVFHHGSAHYSACSTEGSQKRKQPESVDLESPPQPKRHQRNRGSVEDPVRI